MLSTVDETLAKLQWTVDEALTTVLNETLTTVD